MSRDQCVNVTVSHTENLDPTGKLAKKTVRFAAKPSPSPLQLASRPKVRPCGWLGKRFSSGHGLLWGRVC